MNNEKLLMGIDVGTTNWKVALFNTKGKAVFVKKTPTLTHYDKKGNSTYKPDEIWNSISKLISLAVKDYGDSIKAIGVTSMAEAVVPIDSTGNPCYDIITWFDNRSIEEAKEVVSTIGKERLYSITGLDPNPIFSLCKMLWFKKNHPDIYNKSFKWLQMTDFITYKLTGMIATDHTLASRTLAYDVKYKNWSDEILTKMDVDKSLFPDIVESGTIIGHVSKKASQETGLSSDIPVVMGGNDHPCASLSAGVLNGRKILDSSGTAESIIYISEKNMEPNMIFKGQRTCRFLDSNRYALWGGIVSSGASFEWAYKILTSVKEWGFKDSKFNYEDILKNLKDYNPGSNGIIFIPHLRGSGAPYWNPKMRGSFLGLKSTTTKKDMLFSVMEGLSFQVKMIVDMYKDITNEQVEGLCVVGGSGKNNIWQQIKADILQIPIEISQESEATALGAALLAGIGIGIYEDMESASKLVSMKNKIIEPNINNSKIYNELYEIYKLAYNSTVEVSEKLYDFEFINN